MKMTAIHEKSGAWETVQCDAYGRVPRGYRAPTASDLESGRVDGLCDEIRRARSFGDTIAAEQAIGTLRDVIGTTRTTALLRAVCS